ncbi:MAG: BMP family ABC transporter substrate-binding protein, partial [Lachnospiraceae bacterium]|nr:BMP family ABC transporter substrate-binding protein [Lachnospiraceae bacterium]
MKELTNSVVLALTDLYKNGGTWPADLGGKTSVLGAVEGCVGLPTATWSMKNFTVDEYKALFEKVKSGAISISNSTDAAPSVSIAVDYQE